MHGGFAPESLTAERATDALWEGLACAVGKINKQFESVACDLTGGYDSRAVAAAFMGRPKKICFSCFGSRQTVRMLSFP